MIRREVFNKLTKFAYILETDENDALGNLGRSDKRYSNNHLLSGDRRRGMTDDVLSG